MEQLFDDLHGYLREYAKASAEELNALEEDEDFQYYAGTYLSDFRKLNNMTSAIERDRALWLNRDTMVPQSVAKPWKPTGPGWRGIFSQTWCRCWKALTAS